MTTGTAAGLHQTVQALRAEFPTLDQQVHGHPLAYLDNASTTQRPNVVIETIQAFYVNDNSNVHRGVHELSQRATELFERARHTVAAFVNARSDEEVVFTKGCTEAINLVASSWGRTNLGPGDTVLVSTLEHHANLVPWQVVARETGATLEPIPITDQGVLEIDALETRLKAGGVKLVCVKHVCNAIGTVNPVAEIARLAHGHGALVMIDGAQGLAHEKVDVQAMDLDFYSMAGHKVYGPMGMGGLYGRKNLLEAMPPYQTGGGMIRTVTFEETTYAPVPDKFEPGTPNVAGAIGFAKALDWVSAHGVENFAAAERALTASSSSRLAEIPGVRIIGTAPGKAGIVSFVMEQAHPHDVGTVLDFEGVAVRTGHHCCQPLMARMGVAATTRASFAAYNTEEDVDALVRGVKRVAEVFG